VLFAHGLESIFGINVFWNLPLGHITPVIEWNQPLVIGEDAHTDGGSDHDVGSTSKLLDRRLGDLRAVVDSGQSLVRLVLGTQLVLIVGIVGHELLRRVFLSLDFHLLLVRIKWATDNQRLMSVWIK
jgi:hypothetical protein